MVKGQRQKVNAGADRWSALKYPITNTEHPKTKGIDKDKIKEQKAESREPKVGYPNSFSR